MRLLLSSLDPADQDIAVPEELAMILRVALSKMVSAKCLNPELISLEFWRKIPNKFKGIRFYEDRKKTFREVFNSIIINEKFTFRNPNYISLLFFY